MEINLSDIYIYEMPDLSYFEYSCDISSFAIKDFIKNQEDNLKQVMEKFQKQIENDESFKGLDEQDKGSYYDQTYSLEEDTIVEMRRLQHYAIFQLIFANLESKMETICKIIDENWNLDIRLAKIKNKSNLDKFWIYLSDIAKIPTYTIRQKFDKILSLRFVRNKITHQNGEIRKEDIARIPKSDELILKENGEISQIQISNSEYLINLESEMRTFLDALLRLVDEKYQTLPN